MINDIGNILKNKLIGLPFVDRIAGIVQTAVDKTQDSDNKFVIKRFPVSCDVTNKDCEDNTNRLSDLIPNDTKKSIFYFEDIGGVSFVNQIGANMNFVASVRLVAWLNIKKLGKTDCSITSLIVANVIREYNKQKTFNENPFTRIKIKVEKQVIKDANIFAKYTYNQHNTQYLTYPFDYFALDLKVEFSINEKCMNDFNLGIEDECNNI